MEQVIALPFPFQTQQQQLPMAITITSTALRLRFEISPASTATAPKQTPFSTFPMAHSIEAPKDLDAPLVSCPTSETSCNLFSLVDRTAVQQSV